MFCFGLHVTQSCSDTAKEEGKSHRHPFLTLTQDAFASQIEFLASFEGGLLLLNDFVKCTRERKGASSNVLHASILARLPLHRSRDLTGEHVLLIRSLLQCCDSSNALAVLNSVCACGEDQVFSGELSKQEAAALLSYVRCPQGMKVVSDVLKRHAHDLQAIERKALWPEVDSHLDGMMVAVVKCLATHALSLAALVDKNGQSKGLELVGKLSHILQARGVHRTELKQAHEDMLQVLCASFAHLALLTPHHARILSERLLPGLREAEFQVLFTNLSHHFALVSTHPHFAVLWKVLAYIGTPVQDAGVTLDTATKGEMSGLLVRRFLELDEPSRVPFQHIVSHPSMLPHYLTVEREAKGIEDMLRQHQTSRAPLRPHVMHELLQHVETSRMDVYSTTLLLEYILRSLESLLLEGEESAYAYPLILAALRRGQSLGFDDQETNVTCSARMNGSAAALSPHCLFTQVVEGLLSHMKSWIRYPSSSWVMSNLSALLQKQKSPVLQRKFMQAVVRSVENIHMSSETKNALVVASKIPGFGDQILGALKSASLNPTHCWNEELLKTMVLVQESTSNDDVPFMTWEEDFNLMYETHR